MADDKKISLKRLEELELKAAARGIRTYSGFLTESEQSARRSVKPSLTYFLEGGYGSAERKIALFGENDDEALPICCLRISPVAPKFAGSLSHRDFLGALMSLGIKRETLGDIIVFENSGYLFCLQSIADYIIQQLGQVAHTTVTVSRTDAPPEDAGELPPITHIIIASERLDAIIAVVYKLSRAQSRELFLQGRVSVNGRGVSKDFHLAVCGDKISVRGLGRIMFEGVERETKRGRLNAGVRIFR